MHISCSMTCACRTALDVHVKQRTVECAYTSPTLKNIFSQREMNYTATLHSTFPLSLLPSPFSSVTIVSFHCHYCLTLIYDMFLIVSEIIVILSLH